MDQRVRQRPRGARRLPALPFSAFRVVVGSLKAYGVPNRIDNSLTTHLQPAVAAQVAPSFHFLGLTDDVGAPTTGLHELVSAHDTAAWPGALADALRRSYEPLFELPLERVAPGEFHEAFRRAYPEARIDETRKAVAFFLRASLDARIEISPHLMRRRKVPAPGPAGRPRADRVAAQVLIEMLDPDVMSPEEQRAVGTLLLFLQNRGPV